MGERIWTVSNFLSFARVLLVIPIALLLVRGETSDRIYAAGLIVIAAMTDFLDGFYARKLHQVTDLGKIADPVADKIGVGVVGIILAWRGDLPLWLVLLFLVRDLAIMAGGIYIKRLKNMTLASNIAGKVTVGLISACIFTAVIGLPELDLLQKILVASSAVMCLISFGIYFRRFMRIASLTRR